MYDDLCMIKMCDLPTTLHCIQHKRTFIENLFYLKKS